MIKLTTTETHEYFAVPVPKDATDIEQSHFHLFYELPNHIIEKSIYVGREFELLGVIGNGETISEDLAREIVLTLLNDETTEARFIVKKTYSGNLIQILPSKGILLENPIECPRPIKGDTFNIKYGQKRKIWQSYESKLVKAVIIKVKK